MSAEFTIDPAVVRAWKRYPEYKDSGVEWLGEVPAGWEIQKLKLIARVRLSNVDKKSKEGEKGVMLCNYTDVYYNDRITKDLEFMKATASPEEIASFALRQGDVLITKDSEDWKDIAVPAHVDEDLDDVLCGYHLAQIRPDQKAADSKYLFWSFNAHRVNHQFQIAANGITRYGIGKYWINNSSFLVPPLPEQRAIAAFLDRETARIDALIEKKQRFIELLEEKRQALITQAVTKGLDPDVEMKDSGVEWIGEVPKEWKVVALRRVTLSRCDGPFGSGLKSTHYVDSGIRVIRLQNIGHAQFRNEDAAYISVEHYATLGDHSVKAGDLLIAGLGDEKIPAGRACVAPENIEPAMVKADCFRFRLDPRRLQTSFAALQLTSTATVASSVLSSGATRQRINLQSMSDRPIILPPQTEQSHILLFLEKMTLNINHVINHTQRQISLLHEYRAALISAAVTGRIDVRGEVPAAP